MPVKRTSFCPPEDTWRKLPTNNSNFGSLPSGGRHVKVTVPRRGRIGWSTIMRSILPRNGTEQCSETSSSKWTRASLRGKMVILLHGQMLELFQINFASLLFNDVRFVQRSIGFLFQCGAVQRKDVYLIPTRKFNDVNE